MDLTQYILLATVIAGATEFLTRVRAKDLWAAVTIAVAAGIGFLFGVFGVEALTPVTGLAAGIGTSGLVTIVGFRRSTPAPSENVLTK